MAIYFEDTQGDVASIFLSYFQRAPEFEAMQYYVEMLEGFQADPATAADAFKLLAAQIYVDGVQHQEVPAGPTVTDAWYVNYLYHNVLGRAPDEDGLNYWVAELESGAIERAELVGSFVAAALASEGRDAAYVQNRTEVAVEFAQWENSNPQILPTLKYNAAEVLMGVNEDPATVVAAQSRLATSTGEIGETANLTTGIDTLEGTTANDTFNAVFEADTEAASTLTAFDSINGDLGTDTFNVFLGANANTSIPASVSVSNVEIVNLHQGGNANLGGAEDTWLTNAANYEGVQQLWQIGSASRVINVGGDIVSGFRDITEFNGDVELAADAATGTVVLDGVGSAAPELGEGEEAPIPSTSLEVSGDALQTLNVMGNLNDDADLLALTVQAGEGVQELKINSAVDANLAVRANNPTNARINNVDLSNSAGSLILNLDEANSANLATIANGVTITMGAGDDLVLVGAERGLGLRDNLDGGEGDDTLALWVEGTVQTQTYDAIGRAANFESIGFLSDGETTIDAAQVADFDSIVLGGAGAFTVANLDAETEVLVAHSDELAVAGPEALTLENAAADVTLVLDLPVLEGDEEADGAWFSLNVGELGETGGTLSVAGAGQLRYDNSTGKFTTVDLAELAGALDLAGMSAAVAETVVLGAELSATVTATLGQNEEVGDFVYANTSTLGATDTVVGFGDGEDDAIVILVNDPGSAQVHQAEFDEAANLQDALAAAAAQFAEEGYGASDLVLFGFGGDAYLFGDTVNNGGGAYDNGDFLLKVAGVSDLESLANTITYGSYAADLLG